MIFKNMPYCSAFGCSNSTGKPICKEKGISFHRFPLTNDELLKKWLVRIRRKNFYPTKSTVICSEHFVENSFKYQRFTNLRQIKPDAIPTIFCFNAVSEKKRTTNEFGETISHCEAESMPISQDATCFRVSTSHYEAESTPMAQDAACQTDYNIYNVFLEKNAELEKEIAALKEKIEESSFVRKIHINKSKITL